MEADDWAEKMGFLENPFSNAVAEIEELDSNIRPKEFFIEPPYFGKIIGSFNKPPTSCIVFGYRGDGKSFICNRVRDNLIGNHSEKNLVVDYLTFSEDEAPIDEEILKDITFEYHIIGIINLSLKKFLVELAKDSTLLDKLDSNKKRKLNWFIYQYNYENFLDRIQQEEREIQFMEERKSEMYQSFISIKEDIEIAKRSFKGIINLSKRRLFSLNRFLGQRSDLDNMGSLDLLKELRDIIKATGFSSIYILIDKLDEGGLKNWSYINISKFIEPLMTSLSYLELSDVATKMFVPIQIKNILGTKIRSDRVNTIILGWDRDRLWKLLETRIKVFSDGKIKSTEELIEENSINYFIENVLYYSGSNPRNLLRIMFDIISELCVIDPSQEKINEKAITRGIRVFYNIHSTERDSDIYLNRLKNNIEDFEEKLIYKPAQNFL